MDPQIPEHARPFLSGATGYDWNSAVAHEELLEGIAYEAVYEFPARGVILWTSDADIDTDGVDGSKIVDPWFQPETALRTSAGASVSSFSFPGIVIPPAIRALGARLGDYCFVIYNGKPAAAQVYDLGPAKKVGELSLYLGRKIGLIKPSQTDKVAATNGNSATDVVYVIFTGSGPGHALEKDLIQDAVSDLQRPTKV